MNRRYASIAERAGFRCEYCHAPERVFNGRFDVDHVHPTSRGGDHEPSNLALGCGPCNSYKSDVILAPDPATGEPVPLFNPRTQVWDDHFRVAESDLIEGLTVVGRATVQQLRLNGQRQVIARPYWRTLNPFP